MRTAVVSDLHLGLLSQTDVTRSPAVRDRLVAAVSGADHLVLLGDLVELREHPLSDSVNLARPLLEPLGEALAGRRVTIVPGNHDHVLAAPWLAHRRSLGEPLGAEAQWEPGPGDGALHGLASLMPEVDVRAAYPGLRLRPDVYATHGHYLDVHLTVPRIESVAAGAMASITGRGQGCRSAADYEAVVSPMYGFLTGLAESASKDRLQRSGSVSRRVWTRANGGRRLPGLLLTRGAIPAAVAVINRLGWGPLEPGVTGPHLLHGGLASMRTVAGVLAPGAEHVVFGHTHRPGPLPGDEPGEWATPGGGRLWNTGSWCHEPAFLGPPGRPGPYWPGNVLILEDAGPPRIENVLDGISLPAVPA